MKNTSSGEGRSGFDYLAEYIWQVLLDLFVGEAQHINAALCQELGTFCIMCGLFRTKVNATIDFNGQLMLGAKQVENELPVGMLPPKLEVCQLPIT